MTRCDIRMFVPADRDWAVAAQTNLYQTEYGFDDSFGILWGEIIDNFLSGHNPETECGWVAENAGHPLGTIFCMQLSPEVAQLRLFFLLNSARGQGMGHKLLTTCLNFAESVGYKELRLWTHRSHARAGALYRRTGFVMTGAETKLSFGTKQVVESYCYRF